MPSRKTREHFSQDALGEPLRLVLRREFAPGDSLADVQDRLEEILENLHDLIALYGEDAAVRQFLD